MDNQPQKKYVIEISMSTIVKSVLFVLLIVSLYFMRNIVGIVLFAIVIASAIEPAANWFEKKRVPRIIAVLFIYVAVFILSGSMFYMVVPIFISEIANFSSNLPQFFADPSPLQKVFSYLPISDSSLPVILEDIFVRLQDKISAFAAGFFKVAVDVFGGVMSFFFMIVLSFYFSVQKNGLESFLRIITPFEFEDYVLGLWKRSRRKIGLWMQGQILLGILVGVLVFLGLAILRVDYALTFALLAAAFELIPIFGPILASIPPIMLSFLQSPSLGLAVLVLFVIIQQFENHLIYPLVVRKIVGIPPILVILSLLIGGTLGGFFGILLAIPLSTVLIEVLNDLAEKKYVAEKG
ncbi:AI-2E family transporter [Patescibacteria group bacterium]|nr:AI-2E family transporter [Patescibacteria group bacterium]